MICFSAIDIHLQIRCGIGKPNVTNLISFMCGVLKTFVIHSHLTGMNPQVYSYRSTIFASLFCRTSRPKQLTRLKQIWTASSRRRPRKAARSGTGREETTELFHELWQKTDLRIKTNEQFFFSFFLQQCKRNVTMWSSSEQKNDQRCEQCSVCTVSQLVMIFNECAV